MDQHREIHARGRRFLADVTAAAKSDFHIHHLRLFGGDPMDPILFCAGEARCGLDQSFQRYTKLVARPDNFSWINSKAPAIELNIWSPFVHLGPDQILVVDLDARFVAVNPRTDLEDALTLS